MKLFPHGLPLTLVVDSNKTHADFICEAAVRVGCRAFVVLDLAAAQQFLEIQQPDLILCADSLSDGPWSHLKKWIKLSTHVLAPLLSIVVSSANHPMTQVEECGADDAFPLPVEAAVLEQRIRLLLRWAECRHRERAHERTAHDLFHNNPAVMLLIDPVTGGIVDANAAACKFYGYSQQLMLSKSLHDLDVPFSSVDSVRETQLRLFLHRLANGEMRDVSVFSGLVDQNGQRRICMVVHDVTKRKVAEAAERTERLFAEALRRTAETLAETLDLDDVLDRILEGVDAIVQNWGVGIHLIEGAETKALRLRGYVHNGHALYPDNVSFVIENTFTLSTVVHTRHHCLIRDVMSEPRWVQMAGLEWVRSHITVPIMINHHVIGFLAVDSPYVGTYSEQDAIRLQTFANQAATAIRNAQLYRQVMEQAAELERRVEHRTAELNRERAQLNAILDSISEGVLYAELVDSEVRLLYVNKALEEMTGYSASEWTQQSNTLLYYTDRLGVRKSVCSEAFCHIERRAQWSTELEVHCKNGHVFTASFTATRLHDMSGQLVAVIRDISQEKALARQKALFVAYASHELRTPLTNLKTRLYLMQKHPERLPDNIKILENVTDHMRKLIEDLLDLSRFERGNLALRMKQVNLNEMVSQIVGLQIEEAQRKGVILEYDMSEVPIIAWGDVQRLSQVVTNLVVNAINYTPAGGCVHLTLSAQNNSLGDQSNISLKVSDTGIGIAPENLEAIFQPFFRVPSDIEGTGLGLSIAREIMALHHGEIVVESNPGQGSTFTILLPHFTYENQFSEETS